MYICMKTVETHMSHMALKQQHAQHNPEWKIQVGLNGSVTIIQISHREEVFSPPSLLAVGVSTVSLWSLLPHGS